MKRTLLLPLLLVAGCAAGFVALWVSRGALGAWAVPAALGWAVLVSKAFAVALALKHGDR